MPQKSKTNYYHNKQEDFYASISYLTSKASTLLYIVTSSTSTPSANSYTNSPVILVEESHFHFVPPDTTLDNPSQYSRTVKLSDGRETPIATTVKTTIPTDPKHLRTPLHCKHLFNNFLLYLSSICYKNHFRSTLHRSFITKLSHEVRNQEKILVQSPRIYFFYCTW